MERRTLPTWGNATYLRAPSPSEGEGWGGGERSEKQPNWHACSTWLELESTVQAAIHGCFWTRPPHPALPLRGGGFFSMLRVAEDAAAHDLGADLVPAPHELRREHGAAGHLLHPRLQQVRPRREHERPNSDPGRVEVVAQEPRGCEPLDQEAGQRGDHAHDGVAERAHLEDGAAGVADQVGVREGEADHRVA